MKRPLKVKDFRPALAAARDEIPAHFPIHSRLERVLHGQGASVNEKIALEWRQAGHTPKRVHKLGIIGRVDIRICYFRARRLYQLLLHGRALEVRMVEADWQ